MRGQRRRCGIKWVSGYPINQAKGLPYITVIMCLNDPDTGLVKGLDGSQLDNCLETGAATGMPRPRPTPIQGVAEVGLGFRAGPTP
jgi:ornithine cyclodeaminase/alanine dehydrogenase